VKKFSMSMLLSAASLALGLPASSVAEGLDMRNYSPEDASDPNLYLLSHGSGGFSALAKGDAEYNVGILTRNAKVLYENCPSMDGSMSPCIVTFQHKGNEVTKILSARNPPFVGMDVKQAGSLKMQAIGGSVTPIRVCDSPAGVLSNRFGCVTGSDIIYVNKVNTNTWVVEVVSSSKTAYVDVNDVFVNCHGSGETLRAYIADHLPSEDGSPAPDGAECR
jgi:hypothetical protein